MSVGSPVEALVPWPPNATDLGVTPPDGVTTTVPDLLPVELGLNDTCTRQSPFTATFSGQLCDIANCPGLVPPSLIDWMGSTPLPVFVTVTGWAALVVPTGTLPNASAVGDSENWAFTPVPVRFEVRASPLATTRSDADFAPTEVGRNVTSILQLVASAIEEPQLCMRVKRALFAPPTATLSSPTARCRCFSTKGSACVA